MNGESKTSARRIEAREKAAKALELRKAGVTFQAIADKLEYNSAQAAYKAVSDALLRMIKEPAEEVRAMEVARLDAMLLALSPSIAQGSYGAIDRALRIMERRAKLLGLDAPSKQEITGADGGAIPLVIVQRADAPINPSPGETSDEQSTEAE